MTKEEYSLIEKQFDNLGKLFETELKASQDIICNKFNILEGDIHNVKTIINNHVEWHNTVNRDIVGYTIKGGLILFGLVAVIAFIVGFKDGILVTAIAKIVG